MTQQTHRSSSAMQLSALELVESLFSAFAKGDIPYILDHITKDCKWVAPGKGFIPIGGEYLGPEGVARFFQILSQTQEITLFQPKEFFVKGDDVLVLGIEESRVIKTSKRARTNWSMLFRTRDGQVYEWEQLFDTALYAKAHQEEV
jgi:hypothetical protein